MITNTDAEIKVRRKPVTLTIREDIMRDAKSLSLNASKAAEAGIAEALRKARGERWLAENRDAILAYNTEIEARGVAIQPLWDESDR
ncbi:MAG: type II toxin-antitoxin system CcdA family antitoxin [Hyphomicrobium sp.]|jgi:antitoxin CcdA